MRKLSPEQEQLFQRWYAVVARENKLDPNPDAPEHFYDWRGYFEDVKPEVGQHGEFTEHGDYRFPDAYKLPGHPVPPIKDK